MSHVLPSGFSGQLLDLPFAPPCLEGVSGKRELHNDQRHYFDQANMTRFEACAAIAAAFQSEAVTTVIEEAMAVELRDSFLRLELAQDTDGFWLQPHTDLGVKKFTMLTYLAEPDAPRDLGTDLYSSPDQWAKRSDFVDNTALVFVPGANTWHGLEPRPILGVRRSLIINYVTAEWRAREQLSYPETPIRA